ncbi:MAG: hypothetical protein GXO22_00315 [Aquificae bacterium]|nr:hypothetical protein [Aquificota bacterium]
MGGEDNTINHAVMGIIHLVGWSIVIGLIIYFFKKHKKEAKEDERMKKWIQKQNSRKENG